MEYVNMNFLCFIGHHNWKYGIDKKYGEGECWACGKDLGLYRKREKCNKLEIQYHFAMKCVWFIPGR